MESRGLDLSVSHGEEDLRLLESFPEESVDLVYLDPTFFSGWLQASSWTGGAKRPAVEEQEGAEARAYMDWIASPLDDLHRILKPTGAIFLVCDETVGPYVRLLLDELFSQRDPKNQMVWWRAAAGPAHHYVFYYRKSAHTPGRHGHLYTVIHREGSEDWSLVGFSFIQGRTGRRGVSSPA